MNIMAIVMGSAVLALVLVILWVMTLTAKKKRELAEREARDVAYRKAIEASRERDLAERIHKAETGHVATQLFLAKNAELSNPKEALYWYEMAAKADNEIGIHSLIRLCEKYGKEHILLQHKANYWKHVLNMLSGDKLAQFEVGLCLILGRGIEQDKARGVDLIEKVAAQDILKAQLYLGEWYLSEKSGNPDPTKAFHWNNIAVKHKSVEAMVRVGTHYAQGMGVEQNDVIAAYWLESAAETGNARAQFLAGEFWERNTSLENALYLAYIWFFLSAQSGYETAKKRRDSIATQLDIAVIVALQNIAKPIFTRMQEGKIKPLSVYRAFNRMYKRDSYSPGGESTSKPEVSMSFTQQGTISTDSASTEK
ncbi:tetratricopeptide repeat protein [Vibrio sp. SCSIO 43136]|uniref:tetratricopeptide repeat protein n=1 Tax=Vibrio sp. SCSIO 43136 TaxID=2819101 RepID=UPI002076342B|nr:tetratricopeptide repeat protein [Vibrio sp. SCSIO 43136]USD67630.1 sel1 repeat family protein [Vibrio sp. SCSIO 43136]